MYNANNNLEWAGLAKIAGGSVINGLKAMANGSWATSFAQNFGGNASIVGTLLSKLNLVSNLDAIEVQWMEMTASIYKELGWQFEAYQVGGIKEIQRLGSTGDIPGDSPSALVNVVNAWTLIDSGNATNVWQGNLDLVNQEQNVVLSPGYQNLSSLWVIDPGNLAYQALVALDLDPVFNGAGLSVPRALTIGSGTRAPFPGATTFYAWYNANGRPGPLTNDQARWAWIQTLWGQWQTLPAATRNNLINTPIKQLEQ
jgi:hypothetical protein